MAAAGLLGVAFVNGFPLVDYDTGTYISSSYLSYVPSDRPVFYGLLLRFSRVFADSLWSVAVLQALLGSVLLALLLRHHLPEKVPLARFLLGIVVLLCLLSPLPWFTGYVMADVFTGLIFLALATLLLYWSRLSWVERIGCVVVASYGITVHNSHLAIVPLVLVAFWAVSRWTGRLPRAAWGAAWLSFMLPLVAIPLVNNGLSGHLEYSRGSHAFLFARLVEHGSVYELLRDRCDQTAYALCPYREQLQGMTGDEFLWEEDSPFRKIGWWDSRAAIRPMLVDAVRYHPEDIVIGSARSAALQLFMFSIPPSATRSYESARWNVYQKIAARFESEFSAWQRSLQQRGLLQKPARIANAIQTPVLLLALACLSLLALAPGRIPLEVSDESRRLAMVALIFIITNAAVCGILSAENDRYGARVIWLALLVIVAVLLRERTATGSPPLPPVLSRSSLRAS